MKKIVFVTQNLERTGSEMVLWYLLTNLDPQKYKLFVFCMTAGELYRQLPPRIQKTIPYRAKGKRKYKLLIRILKILGINTMEFQIKRLQRKFQADIWYFNSMVMPEIFEFACKLDVKIVTHFHELLHAYTFVRKEELRRIISHSDTCIACSPEVREKIMRMGHRDVRIQHSFIDTGLIRTDPERVNGIKAQLGILPSDFVWVVSGVATYMKGLDRILPILQVFQDRPVKIVWIGRLLDDGLEFYTRRVAETEHPGKLIFTGALTKDYYNYFALGNGYLSLSREECLSLAMLEAAYLGIPIVTLSSGIAPSFIQEGMGKVIKSSKTEDITVAMDWLHQHPIQNARKLRESVMAYSLEKQLPHFEALIDEIIHKPDHASEHVKDKVAQSPGIN